MLAVMALSCIAAAQSPAELRFELGQKLRRFERAWEREPAPARRELATTSAGDAVAKFFRLDVRGAARALDEAWLALDDRAGDRDAAFAAALFATPSCRLLTVGEPLLVTIAPFYERVDLNGLPLDPPPELELVIRWNGAEQRLPWQGDSLVAKFDGTDAPASGALAAVARWSFPGHAHELELPPVRIAVVDRRDDRLGEFATIAERAGDDAPSLETESLRLVLPLLRRLAAGAALESDLAPDALVTLAEQFGAAAASGTPTVGDHGPTELLLRVPLDGRPLPVRMAVPERVAGDDRLRPLVLALHGAGGSENLFFDGYGDGAVARLARARGWYVVAPRNLRPTDAGPLLDALRQRFAFDPGRVFVVGHSMGAATAIAAADVWPARFAKLAALGGGGRVSDREAWRDRPCFVGVGARDFALTGARSLARSLESAGAAVTFREYPGIEHLLVVQVALPDVFAFFGE